MSYNIDLQAINTSLQSVLTSVENLSGRSYATETWELTMEDGSIVEENVQTVAVITFTIASIAYQAIAGMTWEEWINSEFNNSNDPFCWYVVGGMIENSLRQVLSYNDFSYVVLEDVIQDGYPYTIEE